MLFFLILGVVLGAVSVVFALQNTAIVTVSFLTLQIEGSLALILLMTICAGALIAMLIVIPSFIKDIFALRSLRKQNHQLEEELATFKETTIISSVPPYTATTL